MGGDDQSATLLLKDTPEDDELDDVSSFILASVVKPDTRRSRIRVLDLSKVLMNRNGSKTV